MENVLSRDVCIAYALLPFLTPSRIRFLREHFDPLGDIQRAKKLRKPARHPQPVWFKPFG